VIRFQYVDEVATPVELKSTLLLQPFAKKQLQEFISLLKSQTNVSCYFAVVTKQNCSFFVFILQSNSAWRDKLKKSIFIPA
jgi:hypothetical protein